MIRYDDGQEAKVGDRVLLDHGEREGRVSAVIDDDAQIRAWGLTGHGLMIESDYYGLLFLRADTLGHDPVRLLARSGDSQRVSEES